MLLTGQATSQGDADLMRQFAQQLGGSSATLIDQLATRSNGVISNTAPPTATTNSQTYAPAGVVTPGSVVCVNVDNHNELLLTGTVGSPAELAAVENSAQPLAGGARLVDQLTIGTVATASSAGATGGMTGVATNNNTQGARPPESGAAIATSSQPTGTPAATAGNPTVQNDLEQALHSLPRLSNVDAEVTAGSVRLFGSVSSSADDQAARDVARQYAPAYEVIDNVTVSANR